MIQNFRVVTKNGLCAFVDVGGEVFFKKNQPKELLMEVVNTYNSGIQWESKGLTVTLLNDKSIIGYPSIDLNYVIAIYFGKDEEFFPPHNAVIYNADGSIHKVLQVPALKSDFLLNRIRFNKDNNPALEIAQFEGGIYFSQFSWKKHNNKIVNAIDICYDREYYESQILNPETGEFGDCLFSWRN